MIDFNAGSRLISINSLVMEKSFGMHFVAVSHIRLNLRVPTNTNQVLALSPVKYNPCGRASIKLLSIFLKKNYLKKIHI